MRIVQAAGWYYPESLGGTEVYVSTLARELTAQGHEVFVSAPEPGLSRCRSYRHDGVEVFRYPIPVAPTREEAQGEVVVRGAEELHRWLAQLRADIVHIHTFVTGLGLKEICAARTAGSRVVVTTHASSLGFLCQRGTLMWHDERLCDGVVDPVRCAECVLQQRGAPAIAGVTFARVPSALSHAAATLPGPLGTALGMPDLIARNLERQRAMFNVIEAFVVLTDFAAAIVRGNGAPAAKVVVNRLGVRDEAIRAGRTPREIASRPVTVGYVGRFEDVKGVRDLALAMKKIPSDLPLRLEFSGPANSSAERRTKHEVRELLADDPRVTVADAVDPDHVLDRLRTYDVICCPSRCLEGGPTVALEAMTVGVPVIAATVGGVAEVVDDGVNARLVPPGDVESLADALVSIARDPGATIEQWRRRLPPTRTMRDVARDYVTLYTAGD